LGARPPKVKIYDFYCHNSPTLKVKMAPAVDRHWDPLSSLKFWIYVVERFFEKMGFENFGGGALFGFHPLGGGSLPSSDPWRFWA